MGLVAPREQVAHCVSITAFLSSFSQWTNCVASRDRRRSVSSRGSAKITARRARMTSQGIVLGRQQLSAGQGRACKAPLKRISVAKALEQAGRAAKVTRCQRFTEQAGDAETEAEDLGLARRSLGIHIQGNLLAAPVPLVRHALPRCIGQNLRQQGKSRLATRTPVPPGLFLICRACRDLARDSASPWREPPTSAARRDDIPCTRSA